MRSDFQKVEELYHQVLSKPEAQRASFLEFACKGDEELLREVENLIACQQKAGKFLDSPALDVAARMLARTQGRIPTGSRIGSYEVLSVLGAGGMGEVYRARDTKLNREVALKVLPEAFAQAPERMARFQREAHLLAALNHPNIKAGQ
jgi:eukaryotic-like serine/threonine-protein kinase